MTGYEIAAVVAVSALPILVIGALILAAKKQSDQCHHVVPKLRRDFFCAGDGSYLVLVGECIKCGRTISEDGDDLTDNPCLLSHDTKREHGKLIPPQGGSGTAPPKGSVSK